MASGYVVWLDEVGRDDVPAVGGKNASLGEMLRNLADAGIRVPYGFATTADAYRQFVEANGLGEKIATEVTSWRKGETTLARCWQELRRLFIDAPLPEAMAEAVTGAYRELSGQAGGDELDVAVRSSATAEVTVSCCDGSEGFVYDGIVDHEVEEVDLGNLPETRTKVMLNLGEPAAALRWWRLPADGIGLARPTGSAWPGWSSSSTSTSRSIRWRSFTSRNCPTRRHATTSPS